MNINLCVSHIGLPSPNISILCIKENFGKKKKSCIHWNWVWDQK